MLRAAEGATRSLEEYLRALWLLSRTERHRSALPPDVVTGLLTGALTSSVPPFDDAWRATDFAGVARGFEAWERIILSQIADLREFAEAPPQPYPDLGIDAPRTGGTRANGLRWYNHTVPGFLECAMAGALGGWDLRPLTWQEMTEVLGCGQEYE